MAYIPPNPGSTTTGEPTPSGVPKQDVHITDLPPEIRKSFLKSMVFFPSMVGAAICLLMFVGWLLLFNRHKSPEQYALELEGPDMRRRWETARELSDRITPFGQPDSRIYSPKVLSALLKLMSDPELDKEASEWSPSKAMKKEEEVTSIRWWAAKMTGHIAAKLPDPADKTRAYEALAKALEEKNSIAIYAAEGLLLMREVRAVEALNRHLESEADLGMRSICAKALGAIGEYQTAMQTAESSEIAERIHTYLANAYQRENGSADKSEKHENLLNNLAFALGKMHDRAGLDRIRALEAHENAEYRAAARYLREMLEPPAKK